MDTLRSVSHLQRELGNMLFRALTSSDNTEAVKAFAKTLIFNRTMVVSGRGYEVQDYVPASERRYLDEDDCQHLLEHQDEISVALQNRIFVFPGWRYHENPTNVACLRFWNNGWILDWRWDQDLSVVNGTFLRRL